MMSGHGEHQDHQQQRPHPTIYRGNGPLSNSPVEWIEIAQGVTEIAADAFAYCRQLQRVSIPDSVTVIRQSAFAYCISLTQIEIPSSVTRIEQEAFHYSGLTSLVLSDSITWMGKDTFRKCDSLVRIRFPACPNFQLPRNVCRKCSNLQTVELETSDDIAEGAFFECKSLERLEMPPTVKRIQRHAFDGCTSLEHIQFPSNLTEIGANAFHDCRSLRSVQMPDTLQRLHDEAFFGCASLELVDLPNNGHLTIGMGTFRCCPSLFRVHVPSSIEEDMKTKILQQINLENDSFKHLGLKSSGQRGFLVPFPIKLVARVFQDRGCILVSLWSESKGNSVSTVLGPVRRTKRQSSRKAATKNASQPPERLKTSQAIRRSILFNFLKENAVQLLETQLPSSRGTVRPHPLSQS